MPRKPTKARKRRAAPSRKRHIPQPKTSKTLVVLADEHCGHGVGLTHPVYQARYAEGSPAKMAKITRPTKEMYDIYRGWAKEIGRPSIVVNNGDAVDGKGERSGGNEQVTTDRDEQCHMAAMAIEEWKAPQVVMTYGTGYHTGKDDDWEERVAGLVKAEKIGGHEWLDINGLVFDFKHKVGSSQVPHGRHTAPARERLWNILWSEQEMAPKSRVIIRSHVHYFGYAGDATALCITTPALQGPGSKYGVRQCSGLVDFGILVFEVDPHGDYTWAAKTAVLRSRIPRALKL